MEEQQKQLAGMAQPMMQQPMDMMGNYIPQAILQQYPALAGLDWNALPQGPPDEEVYGGNGGGRSSFDGSSGGEYYNNDDVSENEMGGFPNPGQLMGGQQPQYGMPQQQSYSNNQAGDYMAGFEGR